MSEERKLLKGWREIGQALYHIAGISTKTLRRYAPLDLIRRFHGHVYCYLDELEEWWEGRMRKAEEQEKSSARRNARREVQTPPDDSS